MKLRNALLLLLLSWAGLELALQAVHFAFFAESEAVEPASGERFRVLCIGESTTVGYPRDRGSPDAYPQILRRRLEQEFPELQFQVVNRGLNAVTSAKIVEKLPGWLDRLQPHVVVAMLGANDVFYESVADRHALPARLRLALQQLRTVRLAGLALEQLRRLRAEPPPARPGLAPETYRRILALYEQASAFYAQGELVAAEAHFERMRRLIDGQRAGSAAGGSVSRLPGRLLGPYHESTTYLGEIRLRQGRADEALHLYRESIAAEPELPILRFELANLLERLGDEPGARRERAEGEALLSRHVLRSTQENYRKIQAQSAARGAALVATQYPLRDVDNLKVLFRDPDGVRFVDNRDSFADAVERASYRRYFSDRFAGDFGHLTPEGNALLVENLLDQALRELVADFAARRAGGATR